MSPVIEPWPYPYYGAGDFPDRIVIPSGHGIIGPITYHGDPVRPDDTDDEPWQQLDLTDGPRVWIAIGLTAFWATLAALVFVVVVRRVR